MLQCSIVQNGEYSLATYKASNVFNSFKMLSFTLLPFDIHCYHFQLLVCIIMARNTPFKAYNSQRKKLQSLGSLPAKITSHRVDRNEWESSKTKASPSKTNRVRKQQSAKRKTVTTKGLRTAIDVLRYTSDEIQCLHCGRLEHDPNV